MSADNWTECPRCVRDHATAVAKHAADVETAYGKVSAAEYEALKAKVPPRPQDYCLEERYEVGIHPIDGFSVSYQAACGVCGFEYRFNYEDKNVLWGGDRGI